MTMTYLDNLKKELSSISKNVVKAESKFDELCEQIANKKNTPEEIKNFISKASEIKYIIAKLEIKTAYIIENNKIPCPTMRLYEMASKI